MPPITISPVLRDAVELKVDELNQVKEAFKRRYHLNARRTAESDNFKRLKSLLDDISKLNPELESDEDLDIISRYVDQAEDDCSLSGPRLLKLEEQIWSKLHKHLNRLEVSSLHVDLMKEVMDAGDSSVSLAAKLHSADLDDDFEVVETELDEMLEKFEKETFAVEEVDVEAIDAYLSSLFVQPRDKRGLEDIRIDLQTFAEDLLTDGVETDQEHLGWCILDLLKSDVVDKDKKKILEGYLQSPIALRELVAIMNMKSVRDWDYKNASKGLSVTALQNAEGQHYIAVEENVVDLLFLHTVGMGWAEKLKSCLSTAVQIHGSFTTKGLSIEEINKREYFLGRRPAKPRATACTMCHPSYPPAPMPPPPMMGMPPPPPPMAVPLKPGKSKRKISTAWPPPPPPPMPNTMAATRKSNYINDFFMSRLPVMSGCAPKIEQPTEVQARLMKTLAVEAKLCEAFNGSVHTGSVYFKSLASSLPHQTILVVLKFLGIPEFFLEFFERFLSAKLNIGPAVRGAPDRVLPRSRGVQDGHALELFFTEAVMFFLELSVHQKTGSYLYRLKDACYFVGSYEQNRMCGAQVAEFADTLGLEVDFAKAHVIGFLTISSDNVTIDDYKIGTYARRVKKQLDTCTTVLDWVRVWNSTAGTYAAHLFGPLAEVFGKAHLDAVKKAYSRIFGIIFDGGNLTSHVKALLSTHVKRLISDPPFLVESLIYLPQAYGGLGVKNPFVTLNLARSLCENPDAQIKSYLDDEERYYKRAAENYALLPSDAYTRKLEIIFENDNARIESSLGASRDLTIFMTKEELTVHRERAAYPCLPSPPFPAPFVPTTLPMLTSLYATLLREPIDDIPGSGKVRDDVERLEDTGDMKPWKKLTGEDKWVLQLYGDECFERYGGLEIWCSENVPQEVMKAVRGATWDDGDEDNSTTSSDMTDP
ncbi:hypothetical protein GQ44DRAFT_682121 [Phaeosphaeriaceae sp. PMI808]|nr:hypothetical protein GQ44DRAFT_682121 [Phaeosphaeriaceae sp. PMI808]